VNDRDAELLPRSPDLVLLLDRDGVIRLANGPVAGALGKSVFDHFDAEDCARSAFREVVALGEAREVELSRAGPLRWRTRLLPMRSEASAVESVLAIAVDRRDDDEVQRARRLESLGALASGIAHDFRNLLTGILGSASLASMKLPPDSPAAEQISRVLSAAEKAAELSNRVVSYSGTGGGRRVSSDLNAMVEQVLPLVRSSLGKTLSVHLALAPNLPPIEADALELQRLVVSLLVRAGAAGAREAFVRTGAIEADEPSLFLEIRDDGAALEEGAFRDQGTIEAVVRAHRGRLRVETAPGRGTCFTALFPPGRPAEALTPD
jgi:signal transduction histidine kinase